MTGQSRQFASGAVKDLLTPLPPIAINTYSQSQFSSSTGSPPDPAPDLLMDLTHPVTYDVNSDPASNNTYLGRTFVRVAGPSQSSSRRGLQEVFDLTTGHMDCFRDLAEPMKWSGVQHDKPQTCLVQEGNPYLPPDLGLTFVTAILAILKISLAAILTHHPSQLPQSTPAINVALDRVQPDVDKHLQSTSIPHSTVHILCDIPLLERRIHDGREITVQGLLTVEFYRAPERETTTWHRRSALIVMNVPWYLGIEHKNKYEFLDKTYPPPLLNTAASNGAIQDPALESTSASKDLETSMNHDAQPTVIDVSVPSPQPAFEHASAADDISMTDASAACFDVIGIDPFPPVLSRCVSLELWSEKWLFLESFHSRGTQEPMLPGSLPSTTYYSPAGQSFLAGDQYPGVYVSPEQLLHAITGHLPDMHERCHSPENTNTDLGDGSNDHGDDDDDEDSSFETASTDDTSITETTDNDNGDIGTNATRDDGGDEGVFSKDNNDARQHQQSGLITKAAKRYPCTFEVPPTMVNSIPALSRAAPKHSPEEKTRRITGGHTTDLHK
ncbi:hypothetical protein BGZ95_009521 [Linnemannia exigua]|uniref:Uncharacterized protein n=1 Tax=Linnemannia exigua TaxID=604196 RepID=A0AAD4H5M2_9FUNG|nr:hypothetical protein BGZ95_009521 [Linnemannia exigua]